MRQDEVLLREKINGHWIEVLYDDIDPRELLDRCTFDSDEELKEYLDKFRRGYLSMYLIIVKNVCACCGQAEFKDSLGGIEAESPEQALEHFFTSGYAPQYIGVSV